MKKSTWYFFFLLVALLTLVDIGQRFFFTYGREKELIWPLLLLFSSDWIIWLLLLPVIHRVYLFCRRSLKGIEMKFFLFGVIFCIGHLLIKSILFYVIWSSLGHNANFINIIFKMTETIYVSFVSFAGIQLILFWFEPLKVAATIPNTPTTQIAVKNKDSIFFLQEDEVNWLQANDNYVSVYSDKGKYLINDSLSNIEKSLNNIMFMRIHRSAIVNMQKVKSVSTHIKNEPLITLADGSQVRYSKTYRESLMRRLGLKNSPEL